MRPVLVAACLISCCAVSARAQSAADRIIDGPLPIWSAQLTVDVAVQIAKLAKVPLGIEAFPRNPSARLLPPEERRQLSGLTVRQALDWLVHVDPRYRWTELQGVIVVRPAASWEDARHFLNETPDAVLPGLERMFREAGYEPVEGAALLEALNDAVRKGRLIWEIDYGVRKRGHASLWLHDPAGSQGSGIDLPGPLPAWITDAAERAASAAGSKPESPADRTIDGVVIHTRNYLDSLVIARIAKYAKVPVGFEAIPEDPYPAHSTRLPIERQKVLTGLTVREALDWLVELDPRYYWVESRGVIVVRPMLAWGDSRHFLNTIVAPFSIEGRDPADVMGALNELVQKGTFEWPAIPAPVWVPLTMSLESPAGILEVLNDIARTASLCWTLRYEHQPEIGPTATVRFRDAQDTRQVQAGLWLRRPWPRWLDQLTLR